MRYLKSTLLAVFAVLLCLASNCKKPKRQIFGPFPLGEAADYIFFKPGTWWIYKNLKTGELDTQNIIQSWRFWDTVVGEKQTIIDEKYHVYGYKTYGQQGIEFYEHAYVFNALGEGASKVRTMIGWSKQGGPNNGVEFIFEYPFQIYISPDYAGRSTITVDTTVTLNGTTYTPVQVFRKGLDGLSDSWPGYWYFAKGVGVIRHWIPATGDDWVLFDKNIVQ